MVMIEDKEGNEVFHIDKNIHAFLLRGREKINHEDSEFWMMFGGETGCGKSLLAMRCGYIIDPTINLDRICFSHADFIRAVRNAEKGQVIIVDEAISVFFTRNAMTKAGREIAAFTDQIRQKNLCIILCAPRVLTIEEGALEKLKGYFHVWESRKDRKTFKGNVALYVNFQKKKKIDHLVQYLRKRKKQPHKYFVSPKPSARMKGSLINKKVWYPVDEKAYRKKKDSVLEKYEEDCREELGSNDKRWLEQRDKAIYALYESMNRPSRAKLAKILKMPTETVRDSLKKLEIRTKLGVLAVVPRKES